MKVIRARVLGFCSGVRRAVEIAWRLSASQSNVFTLGPLIHNPMVLDDLKSRGIGILDDSDLEALDKESTVIIRAHGIPPDLEERLRCDERQMQKFKLVDATCPHVKASQEKARSFAAKGYVVFLAGEEEHVEISAIKGYAEAGRAGSCRVVARASEAEIAAGELFGRGREIKTVLIGQTTIRADEYHAIAEKIRGFFPGLEILDTICKASSERQKALEELCGSVDAVIVAGSRESANTKRLLSLANELGKEGWLVETKEDIPPDLNKYETIGLCAGASTPDNLIDEIERFLIAN